jgi:transcriptional regulator with GAF, ATPase, and Fis domain
MSTDQGSREEVLAEAFVVLGDTLVDDYDVIDLLHRLTTYCVRLLPVDAAGLLLSDQRGNLRVVSSSTEHARLVELFQLEADEGPCLDCFHTSQPVAAGDLRESTARWPRFAVRAGQEGFRSVQALPMRLRSEVVGALNLFRSQPGLLRPADVRIGQALADVATIGILQERAVRRRDILAEQLQAALNSRVIIEQAKGVLAERGHIDMGKAFTVLRDYARNHNQRLSDVARRVVDRTVDTSGMLSQ